jgi:hypothetical protein
MANPNFESLYIRQFAGIVRNGASPAVWAEWTQRIRDGLSNIGDSTIRTQAQERFVGISNYGSILSEDPKGSRNLVADELEKFADFVSQII